VLYFADELDRERRRAVESACRSDPQVRHWFAELTPTDEDLDDEPLPEVRVDTPEYRSLAAAAYLSVERDEEGWAALAGRFRQGESPAGAAAVVFRMPEKATQSGGRGQVAYREAWPRTLAAGHRPRAMQPAGEIPSIRPDYARGRLTIRQWASAVPRGVVHVFAAKLVGTGQAERYQPLRVELLAGQRPDGGAYWYGEIALASLVPDAQPGDDLVFYAEPAPEEEHPNPAPPQGR